jgi:SAM-dependent methyltransferase
MTIISSHLSLSLYSMDPLPLNIKSTTTSWLNLGIWNGNDDEYEVACRRLALRVGGPGISGRVLDVACGFGESLRLWRSFPAVTHVYGINIAANQVEHCKHLIETSPTIGPPVEIFKHDACQRFSFAPSGEYFDHIVCIDSAYHFNRRKDFFRHAAAALKGSISLTDIVLTSTPTSWLSRLLLSFSCWMCKIPVANMTTREGYRKEMEEWFDDVVVDVFPAEEVLDGFRRWSLERADLLERLSGVWFFTPMSLKLRVTAALIHLLRRADAIAYIHATGRRKNER